MTKTTNKLYDKTIRVDSATEPVFTDTLGISNNDSINIIGIGDGTHGIIYTVQVSNNGKDWANFKSAVTVSGGANFHDSINDINSVFMRISFVFVAGSVAHNIKVSVSNTYSKGGY